MKNFNKKILVPAVTVMSIAGVLNPLSVKADAEMKIENAKSQYETINEMVDSGELSKSGSESDGIEKWQDGDVVRKAVVYPGNDYLKDYTLEYYYTEEEHLVFAFAKDGSEEHRCYYDGEGYLCRYINAEKESKDYDKGRNVYGMDKDEISSKLYYGSLQALEDGEIKDIASKMDLYTYNLMVDSSDEENRSEFVEEMNDELDGLDEEARLAIATNSISYLQAVDTVEEDEIDGYIMDASDIETQYVNLFGTVANVQAMKRVEVSDYDDFYAGHYGRTEQDNIFVAYTLGEDDVKEDSEFVSAEQNDDGSYTVKKNYNFYRHWSHEEPDYVVEATIELKPNADSIYGYNITGVSYK